MSSSRRFVSQRLANSRNTQRTRSFTQKILSTARHVSCVTVKFTITTLNSKFRFMFHSSPKQLIRP